MITEKRAKSRRSGIGWVYFAASERHPMIKIGFTVQPRLRLRQINQFPSVGLMRGDFGPVAYIGLMRGWLTEEYALHRRFKAERCVGMTEWYRSNGELAAYIRRLPLVSMDEAQ